MSEKLCIVMIGLPAAGKTTFRNALLAMRAAKAQEALPAWTHISTDDLIEEHAKKRGETYQECWASYINEAERASLAQLKYAVDAGDGVIVVDRTSLSKRSRARILDLVKSRDNSYRMMAVVVTCRTAEWDKRLRNRPGKDIPELVIKRMQNSYSAPTFEEGFDAVHFVDTTDGLKNMVDETYQEILNMTGMR